MMRLKNIIPLEWKFYLRYLLGGNHSWKDYAESIAPEKRKIVVALAADYGNLGDVAITIAQEEFLKKNFPDCQIIDFPIAMTYSHMKSLKAIIKEDDIITIVGGGNMGDLYPDIESCRRFILKKFPNNRVVSFPQTVFFENSNHLKQCVNAYAKHRKLTIAAREESSYAIMKAQFPKIEVLLTPDIVLSMKPNLDPRERKNALLLIRNDKEGILSNDTREKIIQSLQQIYYAEIADTVIETSRMSIEVRKQRLNALLSKIQSSSVVITNRLHGMIFCAITDTPCVVLPIKGDKITGVLKWIENLNFIQYCKDYDMDTIRECVSAVQNVKPNTLNLDEKYAPLIRALSEF